MENTVKLNSKIPTVVVAEPLVNYSVSEDEEEEEIKNTRWHMPSAQRRNVKTLFDGLGHTFEIKI